MRTLLIISSTFPRWSGDTAPARFVFDLSKHLSEYYKVSVLAPHAPGASRHEVMDGVEVFRFRYFWPTCLQALCNGPGILPTLRTGFIPKLQVPALFGAEFFALRKLLARKRFDAVNSHWMIPQGLTAAMNKKWVPFSHLLTIHSADIHTLRRVPGGSSFCRFVVNKSDHVITVSNHLHRLLEQTMDETVAVDVLPMGVKAEQFHVEVDRAALKQEHGITTKHALLFVGRLVEFKGIPYLLEAMTRIREQSDVTLIIAGSGPLRPALEAKVKTLGLEDCVRFLGPVGHDRLPSLYAMCDVIVIPSLVTQETTEGTPVVLLEAMAAGRPVVGSDVGGIGDVIRDCHNGRLIQSRDPDQLAEGVMSALDPVNWQTWCTNARETGQQYDWQKIAARYRELIDDMIEKRT